MTALVPILLLGFFLGMRHATDPDHVIAIATIVSRERKLSTAAWIGALWGIGHTLTLLIVGGAIVAFGLVVPARLGLSMELSVAVMLIVLGVANLAGLMNWISKSLPAIRTISGHIHYHDRNQGAFFLARPNAENRVHPPHETGDAAPAWLDRTFGGLGVYQAVRPFIVGIVHGLAGSAALALLVLAAIRNPWWALGYLSILGIGTITGMAIITLALAFPFTYATARFGRLNRNLGAAAGFLSVAFGLFLAYQIGFVSGLFTGHPHWTPK